ncbi:MAG: sodium:proton antiporter [Enterococcus sp.]|nr:sodium:proton antiporter [Enterococcus sp.]
MLLSIAIFPMVNNEFWEKNQLKIALVWSLVFLIPFTLAFGLKETGEQLIDSLVLDYIPFLTLLFGLFVVSGGIHIKGTFAGTPKTNVVVLLIGTILASWVGTTGAAMLLIRPLLRANMWRKHRKHVVIFFIFLVANIGGCLTPIGDPPLFLGYLRGVPFFWTLEHIWPILLLNTVILLVVFFIIDSKQLKREDKEHYENYVLQQKVKSKIPVRIEGGQNIVFLLIIIAAVILNGVIPQTDLFIDPSTGNTYGVDIGFGKTLGIEYFVQIVLILLAALLSWVFTQKKYRKANDFEWGPIAEVAKLFLGIFITMIPALALLRAHGGQLGIDSPLKFFWATGSLSAFLDNSPTYVVFLTTAGALGNAGPDAIVTTVGQVMPQILLAISAGAVFMGAITYIGNAPNFMVKSIAERVNIKMPSFFGYMGWSCAILLPVFIIDSLIFFL